MVSTVYLGPAHLADSFHSCYVMSHPLAWDTLVVHSTVENKQDL